MTTALDIKIKCIKEFQNPENWRPNLKLVAEKTGLSYPAVKWFWEKACKEGRMQVSLNYLNDEELAAIMQEDEEDDDEQL